jgi:hypothetical protein
MGREVIFVVESESYAETGRRELLTSVIGIPKMESGHFVLRKIIVGSEGLQHNSVPRVEDKFKIDGSN